MKSRVIACIAAAAAALVTSSAFASAGTARVGITGVHFSVIDLTPDDGVQAGYSLGGGSNGLSIWSFDIPARGLTVAAGQAASIASSYGRLATDVAVGPTLGSAMVSYTEQASGPGGGYFRSVAAQTVEVTLKANSLLIMDVATLAQFDSWPQGTEVSGGVWFKLDRDMVPSTQVWDGFREGYNGANTYQLAFANVLDADTKLTLSLESNLSVTAVPEPSAFMMLPLGLAGVLAVARRRQRAGRA